MKKTLKKIFLGILIFIGIVLLYVYLFYPAEFIHRLVRWGDADVYDYQKFPARELEASDSPFEFALNLNENEIRTQFENTADFDDLDAFLENNQTQAFIVI